MLERRARSYGEVTIAGVPPADTERMEFQLALRRRGITDQAVLRAMDEVPREHFVLPENIDLAYADHAMPIACVTRPSACNTAHDSVSATDKPGDSPEHCPGPGSVSASAPHALHAFDARCSTAATRQASARDQPRSRTAGDPGIRAVRCQGIAHRWRWLSEHGRAS